MKMIAAAVVALLKNVAGTTRTECGLDAAAAESARPIGAFALLEEHDQDQKDANDHVKDRQ